MSGQTTMKPVSWNPAICFPLAFTVNGIKGMLGLLLIGGGIFAYVKLHDRFDSKEMCIRDSVRTDKAANR